MDLHLDFETRSQADLRTVGLYRYASDPSTEVMCTGYAFGDEAPGVLRGSQDLAPSLTWRIRDHVERGGKVVAHNAQFEWVVWNVVLRRQAPFMPPLSTSQMDCTMARAYAMGLPGSLDNCAAALGLDTRKDTRGYRVMLQIAKSQGVVSEQDFDTLMAYCTQDVVVEREVDRRLLPLSESEREVWLLDQHINFRGVQADVKAAQVALEVVEGEADRLDERIRQLSGNQVASTRAHIQVRKWVNDQGVAVKSVDKATVTKLLADPKVPSHVKQVLGVRQEAAKSSTAKLAAITTAACSDGRLRGLFQYHGATTGRWAGRLVQPHNLPRAKYDPALFDVLARHSPADAAEVIRTLHGDPIPTISAALRGFLVAAPGHDLVVLDQSAIEARNTAWLAGQQSVLDLFERGEDVYCHAASGIFRVPVALVTDAQRQVGKVAVLALGFGGGADAFYAMARAYGISMAPVFKSLWERASFETRQRSLEWWEHRKEHTEATREEFLAADITKINWREANPAIVGYWDEVEQAAIAAVESGEVQVAGPVGRQVKFKTSGSFLFCKLPSGRNLCYPYPKCKRTTTPWGTVKNSLRYKSVDSVTGKWEYCATYGGSLVENIVQATARDVLVHGMRLIAQQRYRIVMHVHDEVVVECEDGKLFFDHIRRLMETQPQWAKGLPLSAGGWVGKRYKK